MTGRQYAEGTEVSPGRSRDDIERILMRYGCEEFGTVTKQASAVLAFRTKTRSVRFMLPLPTAQDPDIRFTPKDRRLRTALQQQQELEKETRRRWRSLHLVIKAKLEAVEAGIVTFEQEFAMHFVLPDGSTVAERVLPTIAAAYESGQVRELMPGVTG